MTPDFIDTAFETSDRVFPNDKADTGIIKVFTAISRILNSHNEFGRVEEGKVQLLMISMGEEDASENIFIGIRRTEEDECYIAANEDLEGSL